MDDSESVIARRTVSVTHASTYVVEVRIQAVNAWLQEYHTAKATTMPALGYGQIVAKAPTRLCFVNRYCHGNDILSGINFDSNIKLGT